VPAEVLEHFDLVDPGLPGQPATFACQRCPGIMYPTWWFEERHRESTDAKVAPQGR
jgi:hypothetical protein